MEYVVRLFNAYRRQLSSVCGGGRAISPASVKDRTRAGLKVFLLLLLLLYFGLNFALATLQLCGLKFHFLFLLASLPSGLILFSVAFINSQGTAASIHLSFTARSVLSLITSNQSSYQFSPFSFLLIAPYFKILFLLFIFIYQLPLPPY